jgi:hypothetical protein
MNESKTNKLPRYPVQIVPDACGGIQVSWEKVLTASLRKNLAIYNVFCNGDTVEIEAGKVTETVHLINWQAPENIDFVTDEEVTLHGQHERCHPMVLLKKTNDIR